MILFFILIACVTILICITIFARVAIVIVTVRNKSMLPALEHGDRVLVVRRWLARKVNRGDIVIVWPWDIPSSRSGSFGVNEPYIKRIVGLGGDMLTTHLHELGEYHRPKELAAHDSEGRRIWYIPNGYCFVRGDNPPGGFDSLSWGPIPMRGVLGKVILKLPHTSSRTHKSVVIPDPQFSDNTLLLDRLAPDFVAETLSGEVITKATYQDRAIVFVFVAKGCLPCREVIPHLESVRPSASKGGVEIILIILNDRVQTEAFLHDLNIKLPVLIAPQESNRLSHDYSITTLPFYCFVDDKGIIRSTGNPFPEMKEWKELTQEWTVESKTI